MITKIDQFMKINENSDNKSNEEILNTLKSKYSVIQEIILKFFNAEFGKVHFVSLTVSDDDTLKGDITRRVIFCLKSQLWDIEVDDVAKFKTELAKYQLHFYRILVNCGDYADAGDESVELMISISIDDILTHY